MEQHQEVNPHDQFTAALMLEQNIVGSILKDPTLMTEAVVSLREDMFVNPYHRNLFRMYDELYREGIVIDPVNIMTRYERQMDTIGGFAYLRQLHSSVIFEHHFPDHVQRLVEAYSRAKALRLMNSFRPRFEDPSSGSFEETLDEFERLTLEVRPRKFHRNTGVKNVVQWYEKLVLKREDRTRAFGIMTGWQEIDRMTLGWQRTDLIVVGARTSMGKSAFALEVAMRASRRGYKVAIFSLEMTLEQNYNRMMACLARVSMQSIRVGQLTDSQLGDISVQMDAITKIHIDDERGVTAEYITSEMRRLKRQEGLDLVIIDYLQEVSEPAGHNDNAGSALHRVCQKFRSAAKDCDCSIIGLSQVKREVEVRANKRPMTSDLSGSAAIEAAADGIILLYRDEYYNPDTDDRGVLEVNIAKQRNGPTGVVKMKYEKNYQSITGKGDQEHAEQMALV
ncbi:replicative DNA helicase [Cohnella sp. GCM10020058]|uniref:replicative DNA helicase n=1 Tax=Cohnella sp. GCM10020058 TaxID=3317330 RepID=UPI003640E2D6